MWPDPALTNLLGINLPIVQAPMAGASGPAMAIAASKAGALGSLPCAMRSRDQVLEDLKQFRSSAKGPVNLNFFCHTPPVHNETRSTRWLERLKPYYDELNQVFDPETAKLPTPSRAPFDELMCELIESECPEVVSFHFGLPAPALLTRVKRAGCLVFSSATTVAEARYLEQRGCDVIIAQGAEAGGHRGIFLGADIASQPGTFALLPQVADAVSVPVIAAGGVSDGRGMAAAFILGAAGVQVGTAYLFTPEALITHLHRAALETVTDDQTALTNVFSGRPARSIVNRLMRELGPLSADAPAFPGAGAAIAPLKQAAELLGSSNFSSLWSGQAAALAKPAGAEELTRQLAEDAARLLVGKT